MNRIVVNRLIPASQWDQWHPWPSKSALRALIFNANENGFHEAVRRVAGRVLIDEAEFFAWVDAQGSTHHG